MSLIINSYRYAGGGVESYSDAVLSLSPIAYWRLDESSGSTMIDSSGNGHDGTYSNSPSLEQTGLINEGTSVLFDKTADQYGDAPNDAAFDVSDLTVEFWMDANAPEDFAGIVMRGSGNISSSPWLIRENSGNLEFQTKGGEQVSVTTTLPSGIAHVVCTFDSATGKQAIIINGVEQASGTRSSALGTSADQVTVARDKNYSTRNYDGRLDEIAIYDFAMSEAVAAGHYNKGSSE